MWCIYKFLRFQVPFLFRKINYFEINIDKKNLATYTKQQSDFVNESANFQV